MLRVQQVTGRGRTGSLFPVCAKLQVVLDHGDVVEPREGSQDGLRVRHTDASNRDGERFAKSLRKKYRQYISFSLSVLPFSPEGRWLPPPHPRPMYVCTVHVFCALSGLLTLWPDGSIRSINENFSLMLFGYASAELQDKVQRRIRAVCGRGAVRQRVIRGPLYALSTEHHLPDPWFL